jgi:hypothetical protein
VSGVDPGTFFRKEAHQMSKPKLTDEQKQQLADQKLRDRLEKSARREAAKFEMRMAAVLCRTRLIESRRN